PSYKMIKSGSRVSGIAIIVTHTYAAATTSFPRRINELLGCVRSQPREIGLHCFRSGSYFAGLATSSVTRHLISWSSILLLAPAAIPTATVAAWDGRLLRICKRRKLIP